MEPQSQRSRRFLEDRPSKRMYLVPSGLMGIAHAIFDSVVSLYFWELLFEEAFKAGVVGRVVFAELGNGVLHIPPLSLRGLPVVKG